MRSEKYVDDSIETTILIMEYITFTNKIITHNEWCDTCTI